MKTVLFVCAGNTCRSPLAEALLRRRLKEAGAVDVLTTSAGLGAWGGQPATEEAIAVLDEAGLDLRSHRSQRVTEELVAKSDLILAMEQAQAERLRQLYPNARGRIFGLKEFAGTGGEVADPYAHRGAVDGLAVYRATRDELAETIEAAWPRLVKYLGHKEGGGQS